jgi:hypothetical protein
MAGATLFGCADHDALFLTRFQSQCRGEVITLLRQNRCDGPSSIPGPGGCLLPESHQHDDMNSTRELDWAEGFELHTPDSTLKGK